MLKRKRKIILINKSFQLSLIFKFIMINIVIMIIYGGFLYLFLNSEVESNLYSAHVTYKNIQQMLFPIILTLSIINIMFSSALIFIFVVFASHKISGPMYRFNQILIDFKNKKLKSYFKLREGDQLYEISSSFEELSNNLVADFGLIEKEIELLKQKVLDEPSVNSIKIIQEVIDKYEIK